MANKTKLRCATCGKWFQSANAKDTICPDCAQKARKEKLAAKAAPPAPTKAAVVQNTPPPPKPKPEQARSGTSSWLDKVSDVKVAAPEPPRPKIPSSPTPRIPRSPGDAREGENSANTREEFGNYRNREGGPRPPNRENTYRPPNSPYRVGGGAGLPDAGPRPRQPMEGRGTYSDRPPRPAGQGAPRGGKPKVKTPKPPPPPKPKREKIEPPKPFVPTDEQITQIETRYLELATPIEFDGIRTQIAHELEIPKTAVKKVIKDLRDRQNIPSWWDTQTYKGSEEELTKIKTAYEPFLPLPDVGVHKKIAEDLSLKPGDVYQAIKKIRADMGLPQYNDPELHPELKEIELERQKAREARRVAALAEKQAAASEALATAETPSAEASATSDSHPASETPATTEEPSAEAAAPIESQQPAETPSAPVPTDTLSGTDTEAVVDAVQATEEARPEEVSAESKAEVTQSNEA